MIPPKIITITRAEGPTAECNKPRTASSWLEANFALRCWASTAPENGGYDKCDFKVEFEDGETYEGRYDLVHYRKENPDLARHVRDFCRYLAGELPSWCTKPKDIERVRYHQAELAKDGSRADAIQFLANYDLGG
jgi:hypothetical protein